MVSFHYIKMKKSFKNQFLEVLLKELKAVDGGNLPFCK